MRSAWMMGHNSAAPLWLPSTLRRRTLFLFAIFFVGLAIGLGSIYWISQKHNGLATPTLKYRYFWTYSPTVVFITTSGLWSLIDYYSRALAPWRSLSCGRSINAKDLSLDYTSTNHYHVFVKSWRNKHRSVTLAAAGTICLDLLIILSTGLFIAQPAVVYTSNYQFAMETQFNGSRTPDTMGNSLSNAYAVSLYGLGMPKGTTGDFAYAKFDDEALPKDATARLDVDAVWPEVTCELGNANLTFGLQGVTNSSNGTAGTKVEISAGNNCRNVYNWPFIDTKLLDKYTFAITSMLCYANDNKTILSSKLTILAGLTKLSNDSVIETQRNIRNATKEGPFGTPPGATYFVPLRNRTISSSASCVACTIKSRVRKASLTKSGTDWSPQLIAPTDSLENEAILGYNQNYTQDLQFKIYIAITGALMSDSQYLVGLGTTGPTSPLNKTIGPWSSYWAPFFQIMNQTNPRESVDDMLDTNFLLDSTRKTFQLITSQLLATTFFPKSSTTVDGKLERFETRLMVSPVALGLIIALLIAMLGITVALVLCARGTTKEDPSSIASKASILVNHPEIISNMHSNRASDQHMNHFLSHGEDDPVKLKQTGKDGYPVSDVQKEASCESYPLSHPLIPSSIEWWDPWSSSFSCRLLAVFSPCAIFAILEGLQRWSDHHQGVANVSEHALIHHAWVYLPVLVVVLLTAIFTAASSTDRIVQPFVALRDKPCPPSQALSLDFVNRTTVSAMYFAVKLKHFGTAAAILATLLGTALPIAVSGLYRTKDQYQSHGVTLARTSGFNASVNIGTMNTSLDFYPVPGFVVYQNLSFPQWTYGKYALPSFEVQDKVKSPGASMSSSRSQLNAQLPAIFGVANCSVLPKDQSSFSTRRSASNPTTIPIYLDMIATQGCPRASLGIGTTASMATQNFVVAGWKGLNYNSLLNATSSLDNNASTPLATWHGANGITKGCPASIAVIGRGTYSNKTGALDMSDAITFACTPYVAQEMLNVTFTMPDLSISPAQPPQAVPNTKAFFSETELINNWGFDAFLPNYRSMIIDPKVPGLMADTAFKAVFSGAMGILPSEFMGADNATLTHDDASMQRLQDRIEQVYGYTVAQIYDGKKRVKADAGSSPVDVWDGIISSAVGSRIVQDNTSARILQGLLAAMTLCAIVAMIMIDGKRILPKNPCSIGATVLLLENSSLLNDGILPPEAETMSDKEMKKRGFLEHYMFSLGFWGTGEKAWYGIDIGKADKEK